MKKIKNYFLNLKSEYKSASLEEKLLILTSVCMFLPLFVIGRELIFTFVGIPFLTIVGVSLARKETRKKVFSVSNKWSFIAFGVIGVAAAAANLNVLGILGGVFILALIVFTFFARAYMTERLWERITENICLLSVLSFMIGVIDYVVRYSPDSEHRTASTFFNANYYAFIIEIIVVLCVYKISKHPNKWYKYLLIALINCSAILFCKTRTALVAIFIGVFAYFFFAKKWKIVIAVGAVIAAVAAATVIAPEIFLPRYETFFWSLNDRFEIWGTAVKNLGYRPLFGQGLWAYWRIVEMFGGRFAVNAHCIWLDTFLSFGIVGTCFVFYHFIRTTYQGVKKLDLRKRAALLALVLTVLAHCTIDLAITGIETSIMAMLIYGIVGNGNKEKAEVPV